jgi:hypothetical protein
MAVMTFVRMHQHMLLALTVAITLPNVPKKISVGLSLAMFASRISISRGESALSIPRNESKEASFFQGRGARIDQALSSTSSRWNYRDHCLVLSHAGAGLSKEGLLQRVIYIGFVLLCFPSAHSS